MVAIVAATALLVCGGIVTLMLAPHIAKRQLEAQQNTETMRSLADSPNSSEWTTDAKLVERLGAEVSMRGFTLRLPTAFTPAYPGSLQPPVISIPGGGTGQSWMWVGPRLPSGRHALFEVEVRLPPTGLDARTYFEKEFPAELRAMQKSLKLSEVVAGRTAGTRAIRVTYVMPEGPLECIALFRFEPDCQLVVTVRCPSADRSEVLPLLEAAQLTARAAGQLRAAPPLNAGPAIEAPAAK